MMHRRGQLRNKSWNLPQNSETPDWIDAGELKEINLARNEFEKNKPVKDPQEVGGVKGWLIRFIDDAFEYLKYV